MIVGKVKNMESNIEYVYILLNGVVRKGRGREGGIKKYEIYL